MSDETLGAYRLKQQLYASVHSVIYRAVRERDDQPVIIKYHNTDFPTEEQLASLRSEYELLSNLHDVAAIPRIFGLESIEGTLVLVMEDDTNNISFSEMLSAGAIATDQALRYAAEIAAIVKVLHKRGIIHRDIKPQNMIINTLTREIKLIDFGNAIKKADVEAMTVKETSLHGTLAYIAPEQTGRVGRRVDERSDLYSLGISLYELFTRKLPFLAGDVLGWIHCHLTQTPLEPHLVRPEIGPGLSAIIMKLIAKDPDHRYPSAGSLAHDLNECLRLVAAKQEIGLFALDTYDSRKSIHFPDELFDVGPLIATLNEKLSGAQEHGSAVLLIGPAGCGKTSLVQAWEKQHVTGSQFVCGQFVGGAAQTAYQPLLDALSSRMRRLLMSSNDDVALIRQRLIKRLGGNGRLLCGLLPDLELIIGQQPELTQIGAMEAQNRFLVTMSRLLGALADHDDPLVILFDDVHEADPASLELLEKLIDGYLEPGVMLVCCARNADHQAPQAMFEGGCWNSPAVHRIEMKGLSSTQVSRIITQALGQTGEEVTILARTLFEKTGGNGSSLKEMMTSLVKDRILLHHAELDKWSWDITKVTELQANFDVVATLSQRLHDLPEATLAPLKVAAAIGVEFDLEMIAELTETTPQKVEDALGVAIFHGLIAYQKRPTTCPAPTKGQADAPPSVPNCVMRFSHPHIQLAASELSDEAEHHSIHYRIGKHALARAEAAPEKKPFLYPLLAQHWNRAGACIATPAERIVLIQANCAAAAKAKAQFAYSDAKSFCEKALPHVDESFWETHYQLILDLFNELVECNYVTSDIKSMEKHAATVIVRARSVLDKIRVIETRIQVEITAHRPAGGLQIALATLKELDIRLPRKANVLQVGINLLRVRWKLTHRRRDRILEQGEMTDECLLAAMRILSRAASAAYIADQNMFGLIVFKTIELSLRYGNAPASAFAFATYGLLQCGVVGDINYGYSFAKIAGDLLVKLNAQHLAANIAVVCGFIRGWKEPIKATLDSLLEAYHQGLGHGDLEFAAYGAFMYCNHAYCVGTNLVDLEAHMRKTAGWIKQIKQHSALQMNAIYWQTVLNLMGGASDPTKLIGEAYNEDAFLALHQKMNEISIISVFYLEKLILSYTFADLGEAWHAITKGRRYRDGMLGTYGIPAFNFYESLTRIALLKKSSWVKRIVHRGAILVNQFQMRRFSRHAPTNYQHKWLLVAAELARWSHRHLRAQRLYDRALHAAKESGFIQEEALAFELAAGFYLQTGQRIIAQTYMTKAWFLYKQWGASGKVRQIEQRYPTLVRQREARGLPQRTATVAATATSATRNSIKKSSTITDGPETGHSLMDVDSLLKAAQAISSEIRLESLLASVLKTIAENAGAESCVLMLKERDKKNLEIRARLQGEDNDVIHLGPEQYHDFSGVPLNVVNLAQRTRQAQVVYDARMDRQFADDGYIKRHQPVSLLCCPLIRQGEMVGMLYAENNLAAGIFTPARVEIVQMMGSLAAVAIDNALLYKNLEQKVAERTSQLREKTDNINSMLQNLNQGIFTILEGGLIHPEYSKYLEVIFETSDIRRMSAHDLLFQNCNLTRNEIDQNIATLGVILGQNALSFVANSHLLASECKKRMADGRIKILEIDWNPLENDDGIIEKMMVTVRDVTMIRGLVQRANEQQRQLTILGQLLASSAEECHNFLDGAREHLDECRKIVAAGDIKGDRLAALLRSLHTMKGNARVMGYTFIGELVHNGESLLAEYRASEQLVDDSKVHGIFSDITALLAEYQQISSEKLQRKPKAPSLTAQPIFAEYALQLREMVTSHEVSDQEAVVLYGRLTAAMRSASLEDILERSAVNTRLLAPKLDKSAPIFHSEDHGLRISHLIASRLSDLMLHASTNAVYHGLETSALRTLSGKPAAGCITALLTCEGEDFVLNIKDDGRGIDLVAVKNRALALGISPDQLPVSDPAAIASLIFLSGVSTEGEVNEVSGRGVGMDAIRNLAREFGGDAQLVVANEAPSSGSVPFELQVTIPRKYVLETADLFEIFSRKKAA